MRDILKAKFLCNGYELRDDDCLYSLKTNQCIATDVQVVSEDSDHIAFSLNAVSDGGAFERMGIKINPSTLH
jgi:hypothetical protein